MKIEDLLFAMCDDTNDYIDDANSSLKCHESDEGCCIINPGRMSPSKDTSPTSSLLPAQNFLELRVSSSGEPMRRVKSTPNLLEIPAPFRHRKRSDDSAVGSAEETESYRSNDSLPSGGEASPSKKIYSSYRHSCPQETSSSAVSSSSSTASSYKSCSVSPHRQIHNLPMLVTQARLAPSQNPEKFRRSISSNAPSGCTSPPSHGGCAKRISLTSSYGGPSCASASSSVPVTPTTPVSGFGPLADVKLLRPPSVVISDHDLCLEEGETFITLEELDAEFSVQQHRRRFSDCSTCSSLSFSESDLTALSNEEESEEAAVQRVRKTIFYLFFINIPNT